MEPIILKKVKMLGDPSQFSWSQAFSDKTGKSSITSILSAVVVVGGMLVFIMSGITALFGIASAPGICAWAVAVVTLGMAGVGVNKVMGGKPVPEDVIVDPNKPDSKDASDVASPPNGPK